MIKSKETAKYLKLLTMILFIVGALIVVSGLMPLITSAMTCISSDVCTISKTDFEFNDIGTFKVHQYSYSEFEKDELMNFQITSAENRSRLNKGVYRSVGYYSPSSPSVEYYSDIMQFPSKVEALKLIEAYLGEYKENNYGNTSGSIYQIEGPNGSSIFWLHKNLIIHIYSVKDASQKEKFRDQAFNVYSLKFPPEKISLRDLKIKEKKVSTEKFSTIEMTAPKPGGKALIVDKKVDIKWKSDKKEFPKVDLWIMNSQDTTDYQYIATNLKNKGKFSWKIPKDIEAGQYQLLIGVPGETTLRSGVNIEIQKSLSQIEKELKDAVKKGTIKDYSGCHNYANQFSDVSNWQKIYKSCDGLIYNKVNYEEKNVSKNEYNICGNEYKIEPIAILNGVDRLKVIESLMKVNNTPQGVCSDFDKVLKGKEVSINVRDTNQPSLGNYSIVTLIDTKDLPKKMKGHEHINVGFSFDWITGSVYYFPSTLINGDATYLGKYN